jgi:hypothetical protein
MSKKRTAVAAILATAVLSLTQYAYGATPPVSTSPTFSLDFSDSSKVSGSTWTDQVAGLSASAVGTQFSPELGGIESFTASASYLDFGKPAIGTAANPSSDISAEVWVKFSSFNTNWNIFLTRWFDDSAGNSTASDFHFAVYSDGTSPRQLNLYTTNKFDLRGATTIILNKWYHFVFTIDNTSTTKREVLYVNNTADAVYASPSVIRVANSANRTYVGDARSLVSPNGVIAKVRMYNRALSATEVQSNFFVERAAFGYQANVSISAANGIYRAAQTLTATSSQAGKATFYANNKVIPGCMKKAITTTVTCSWKPAIHGFNNVKVTVTPTDAQYADGSAQSTLFIVKRSNNR